MNFECDNHHNVNSKQEQSRKQHLITRQKKTQKKHQTAHHLQAPAGTVQQRTSVSPAVKKYCKFNTL